MRLGLNGRRGNANGGGSSGTSPRWRAAGALAAVSVALGVGADGALANADAGVVRIVTPAPNALGADGRVRVVVRLAPGARRFNATVGGRDVSRRFKQRGPSGRTRVAILRRGRDRGLRHGTNYLYVRARGRHGAQGIDSERFVLARRSERFVRTPGRRTGAGTMRLRLRVRHPRALTRVTVNGERVRVAPGRGRLRSTVLAGDDGLRHGRNRIRVVAYDPRRGVYDVDSAAYRVRRTRPIPAAGRPRRSPVRRVLRLDGRKSRAARRGTLRYRWRIVRRPRGSKARLRGAGSARPRLVPDVRGTYRVKLTVSQRRRGASAAALASASDMLPIAVPPSDPTGLELATDTGGPGRGVVLGTERLAPVDAAASLQLVLLSRGTLGLLANESYAGTADGTAALVKRLQGLTSSTLAILTTPRADAGPPTADAGSLATLNRAIARIAGEAVGSGVNGFTVVGIPGMDASDADRNNGLARTPGGNPGEMSGYLQLDSTGVNFAYVSADYVPFDTLADQSSPVRAAIGIGDCSPAPQVPPGIPQPLRKPCTTYTSRSLPPSSNGGLYVLVLDAGTLEKRDEETFDFELNANFVPTLNSLHAFLAKYKDMSSLVLMQSIGRLVRPESQSPRFTAWNTIAADQAGLGSNPYLFTQLTQGGYALVAPGAKRTPGCDYPCVSQDVSVAGPTATGVPARLKGVLSRNDRSQFHAAGADSSPSMPDSFMATAYQPRVPWPMRDSVHAPALQCITNAIANRSGSSLLTPIQRNYWSTRSGAFKVVEAGTASKWLSIVGTLTPATVEDVPGCADAAVASGFNDVKTQLTREFSYLVDVAVLLNDLKQPFVLSASSSSVEVQRIIDSVTKTINTPASETTVEGTAVEADVIEMVGLAVGAAGKAFEPYAVGIELLGSLVSLAGEFAKDSEGNTDIDVTTTADAIAYDVSNRLGKAAATFNQLGGLLVSDWGRLSRAGLNADGSWAIADRDVIGATKALDATAARTAYRALFPLRYGLYILGQPGQARTLNTPAVFGCGVYRRIGGGGTNPNPYEEWVYDQSPFSEYSASGALKVVPSAGSPPSWWVFGNNDSSFITWSNGVPTTGSAPHLKGGNLPPATVTDPMFKTPGPDGVTPMFPSMLRFMLDVLHRTKSGPSVPKLVATRNFNDPPDSPPPGHQCHLGKAP